MDPTGRGSRIDVKQSQSVMGGGNNQEGGVNPTVEAPHSSYLEPPGQPSHSFSNPSTSSGSASTMTTTLPGFEYWPPDTVKAVIDTSKKPAETWTYGGVLNQPKTSLLDLQARHVVLASKPSEAVKTWMVLYVKEATQTTALVVLEDPRTDKLHHVRLYT